MVAEKQKQGGGRQNERGRQGVRDWEGMKRTEEVRGKEGGMSVSRWLFLLQNFIPAQSNQGC